MFVWFEVHSPGDKGRGAFGMKNFKYDKTSLKRTRSRVTKRIIIKEKKNILKQNGLSSYTHSKARVFCEIALERFPAG